MKKKTKNKIIKKIQVKKRSARIKSSPKKRFSPKKKAHVRKKNIKRPKDRKKVIIKKKQTVKKIKPTIKKQIPAKKKIIKKKSPVHSKILASKKKAITKKAVGNKTDSVVAGKQELPEDIKRIKIKVIGIGGGGGAIVSDIAAKISRANFTVANTDIQDLKGAGRKVSRFHFGQNLTHGLGTGMNAELGREAAQNEKEKIKKILEGQDLCVFVVCLGGGTGAGAVPVFAKIAKELGNISYGIFTLPFNFEGEKKMEIAKESLRQVKNYLNAMTIIPNERVFQVIDKDTPLREALSVVNKSLSESLGSLIKTIYEPGIINIDYADFKAVMEGRGKLAYLNTIEAQRKDDSTKELMAKALNSPFYPYTIKGAKGILFNIGGEKKLSLEEVNLISKNISDLANKDAKIVFGISQETKNTNSIKITLFATGCGGKFFTPEQKKPVKNTKKNPPRKAGEAEEKSDVSQKKKKAQFNKNKKSVKKKSTSHEPRHQAPVNKPIVKKKMNKKVRIPLRENLVSSKDSEIKEEKEPTAQEKVRKTGLQLRKETEAEIEKETLEKEKFWETPAFLQENKNQE